MKKNIDLLKDKVASRNTFVSVKGGKKIIGIDDDIFATNGEGCINSGDCTKAVNKLKCSNTGTCQ